MLKKVTVIVLGVFYIGAGINHFLHPSGYYSIIPPYLPDPYLINLSAGIAEIILGVTVLVRRTRKLAGYGIAVMLIAFIPAHIYMIQKGGCMGPKPALCIPLWLAWVRLVLLQPILIWWAWKARKM